MSLINISIFTISLLVNINSIFIFEVRGKIHVGMFPALVGISVANASSVKDIICFPVFIDFTIVTFAL